MSDKYENYSLELMNTGLMFLNHARLNSNVFSLNHDPFRSLVVYSIHKLKNDFWLPLNRNYKPIGINSTRYICFESEKRDSFSCWADYEDEKYKHLRIHNDDINFDLLWDNQPDYFLYSDFTNVTFGRKYQKNLSRYEKILSHTFFGLETNLTFEKAWGYKNNISYANEYERNLKRFS